MFYTYIYTYIKGVCVFATFDAKRGAWVFPA